MKGKRNLTAETRPGTGSGTGPVYSRVLAAIVLVPAVPMLLLSVGTLLLFYLAPTRFGELLSRLPGESFIRSALVFAPATLFAIVVLAVLYAVEKPEEAARVEEVARAVQPARARRWNLRSIARISLAPFALAWLFSLGLWSLSFISPGRYDRLLKPLPGDAYLRSLTSIAPWILFVVVIVSALLAFTQDTSKEGSSVRERAGLGASTRRLVRPAVGAVLASSVPALLGSLAALGLYWLQPDRFARLLERLPFDTLVRAAMVFVPPTSFVVVVLASLYLMGASQGELSPETRPNKIRSSRRSDLGMFVLVAGLGVSAALGLGLLGSILYLILR
jgi:hypothetical protein